MKEEFYREVEEVERGGGKNKEERGSQKRCQEAKKGVSHLFLA
jgi:hypothetical protein